MTCSKSTVNAVRLCEQDNTNGTCAADMEQIIIWLANNTVNEINEIMTCSKSTANASDHANKTTLMEYANDTGQIII